MALEERLREDMKHALRTGQQFRLSVLRLALAAIKNRAIDAKRELSDEEAVEVLASEVKKRREAILEYQKVNRQDVAESLQNEIAILMEYMPAQMDEGEVRELALGIIQEVGATGPKDIGKVMGAIMPRVKGRADGKVVNKIVQELLKGS